jgi:maleate isomerase
MSRSFRIGLIVPSSNTTMEIELAELFRRRQQAAPDRFSFHSARMRMTQVTPEALAVMDRESGRCAAELADAECDIVAYACLVAVMVAGKGAHIAAAQRLSQAASRDQPTPVVTSAGALGAAISAIGATRIALIAPYLPSLTERVVDYLADLGIEVVDAVSLGVSDNRRVGRLDPADLVPLSRSLNLARADAVVLSACVQMPSLPAIPEVEHRLGLPVLSAATATARELLSGLGLQPMVHGAGYLLEKGLASTLR